MTSQLWAVHFLLGSSLGSHFLLGSSLFAGQFTGQSHFAGQFTFFAGQFTFCWAVNFLTSARNSFDHRQLPVDFSF